MSNMWFVQLTHPFGTSNEGKLSMTPGHYRTLKPSIILGSCKAFASSLRGSTDLDKALCGIELKCPVEAVVERFQCDEDYRCLSICYSSII